MFENKTHSYKKLLSVILTIALVVTVIPFSFSAHAFSGNGTVESPYTIASYDDLKDFADKVNNDETGIYGKLSGDIVINKAWTPIKNYTGIFDGNNFTITYGANFSFNTNDNGVYGLFAKNEGTIRNLKIASTNNISINVELDFAGSIVGANYGTIENCTSSVNFTSTAKNAYIGGIAGVSSGTITNCQNSGTITISTNTTEGELDDKEATAGGIVALNLEGTVEKCTNSGIIQNSDTFGYTGGIAGCNEGEVNNCLNTANVTNSNATQFAAGITGLLFTGTDGTTATIKNSLDTYTSGKIIGTNGTDDHAGTISNTFYIGTGNEGIDGVEHVDSNVLTTGEVTFKLNGNTYIDPTWYQVISTDTFPTLQKIENGDVVYKVQNGYSNTSDICTNNHRYDKNGICTICGTPIAYVDGYSVTTNGTIGLNYYYYIDPEYIDGNTIKVSYSIEGRTGEVMFDKTAFKDVSDKKLYKFQIPVYSDEMTSNVTTTINISTGNNSYSLSKEYSVAEYLLKLLNDDTKDDELKALAKSMLTYDYYAYKYFNGTTYNPEVALNTLESKTTIQGAISSVTGNVNTSNTSSGNNSALKNYSTSLTLQSTIMCQFGAQKIGDSVSGTIYMRYVKNGTTFSNEKPVTARAQSNFFIADTEGIAPAELDTLYDVQFGTYDNNTFTPLTTTKIAGPYTYINSVLNAYESEEGTITNGKEDLVNLIKALYGYSQAAKAYFTSSTN